VDYLFLQVGVAEAFVTDKQNCGNLLAGVGPFAVERGLVKAAGERISVRIHLVNAGESATASFSARDGRVDYTEPILLSFAAPTGKALLPTGNLVDELDGVQATCIDNGMPSVVLRAVDLGVSGYESPAELEANGQLTAHIARIREDAVRLMGLGDAPSLPKISLLAPPRDGGAVSTRTFIPVRVHEAIGVLGAVSVATALLLPGAIGTELARLPHETGAPLRLEHPTGSVDVSVELDPEHPRTGRAPAAPGWSAPHESFSRAPFSLAPPRRTERRTGTSAHDYVRLPRGRAPRPRRAAHPGARGEPAVLHRGHGPA
jgi:4-oxalomesaconate tautomerase